MIHIQDIMRAGHIKRWNIINTTRQQTLAEHMYNVTMISMTLCERLGRQDLTQQVMKWALIHDVPEVVCGDTPTPTKLRIKEHGLDMEEIYESIDQDYYLVKNNTTEEAKWIVKISDIIEGYWFIREHGVGDHAKKVACSLYDRIIDMLADQKDAFKTETVRTLMNNVVSGETYE